MNPLRDHFVQRSVLFVLVDIQKVRQHPDQDQFGMSCLKMILVESSVLTGQNLHTIGGGQNASFVEWVQQDAAVSDHEMPREIDSFDLKSGSSPNDHVEEGKRNRNPKPGIYHAV